MFTRRHYEFLAEFCAHLSVRERRKFAEHARSEMFTPREVAQHLSDALAEDNPEFNIGKFMREFLSIVPEGDL